MRNSCDHGIEIPVERLANGKPEHSTITLAASHQGGSIQIEVRDDGKGLSRDKLVKKARERGIEAPDSMTDAEVWSLIFAPGFSTADVVTDVSGRGVGMDVVKKNITALGSTVEVDSAEGYGMSVKVRLPLTLAVMDGMSVGVGDEVYILPLSSVIESFQVQADNIKTIGGSGRVIKVRAEFMQVLDSEQVFGVPRVDFESAGGIMVVAEAEGGRVALRVDQLLGQKGGGEEPGVQLPPRARHLGRHDRGRRPRRAHPRCRQPGASLTPLNPHRSIRNLIPRFAAITMNLNNLRIGPRLAIGFGTVLLLLVAIVAIACLQLARTANGLTGLDHSDERAAIARDWAGKTQLNIVRAIAIAKASGQPDAESFFGPQVKQTSAEIGELQKSLERLIVTDKSKALMAEVAANRKTYVAHREALFALVKQADAPAAEALLSAEVLPVSEVYVASMQAVQR